MKATQLEPGMKLAQSMCNYFTVLLPKGELDPK